MPVLEVASTRRIVLIVIIAVVLPLFGGFMSAAWKLYASLRRATNQVERALGDFD